MMGQASFWVRVGPGNARRLCPEQLTPSLNSPPPPPPVSTLAPPPSRTGSLAAKSPGLSTGTRLPALLLTDNLGR